METSSVPQMASALSTYHQTTQSAQRSLHSQLPQRRLQYWSCPGVQLHRTKKPGHPGINTASTSDSASAQIPQQGRGSPRGPPGSGCHLQVGPLEGGHPLFGHVGSRRNGQALSQLVQHQPTDHGAPHWAKQQTHLKYTKNPCEKMLTALPAARSLTQSTARPCANEYWLKLCNEVQLATVLGNIRGM